MQIINGKGKVTNGHTDEQMPQGPRATMLKDLANIISTKIRSRAPRDKLALSRNAFLELLEEPLFGSKLETNAEKRSHSNGWTAIDNYFGMIETTSSEPTYSWQTEKE